jgi:hypothetical protein
MTMFLSTKPLTGLSSVFLSGTLLLSGCAEAQTEAGVPIMPQPEAPLVKPPVAPAPFATTVWRAGQSGVLNLSGPLQGYKGEIRVRDFSGKQVWSGQANDKSVKIPVSKTGLYTLSAGKNIFSFSVVPVPVKSLSNRMLIGLNTHFAQRDAPEEAYKILQTLGVDAVRDEMGWTPIEKVKGVYTFPQRHLEYNAKLKQYKIPLHWSASYGNELYPVIGRHPTAEAAVPYSRYVVEVLKKFGDNIIGVEILNEPNKLPPKKDYSPVLKATVTAVRAAGFKQPIVAIGGAGPLGGGMVPGYARTVFDTGVTADGFSQHPYMAPFPPDTGYAARTNGAANLDAALTRAGNVVRDFNLKGSYITELGWSSIEEGQKPTVEEYSDNRSARTMISEPKQAAFTARTLLGASKYDYLKAIYIYDFQDDGPLPLRREHRFGLVRQDLQPKMGLQAYAVTSNFLRDKTFVKSIILPDSLLRGNLYRSSTGENWLAVWSTEVTAADVDDVIARKDKEPNATLPPRHMENENHVSFRIKNATGNSGYDWQGQPLKTSSTMLATSLPTYLHLGRNVANVDLEAIAVKKVKDGSKGFPAKEVESLIAAKNAATPAPANK